MARKPARVSSARDFQGPRDPAHADLREALRLEREGRCDLAARILDRAWRTFPEDRARVAPHYGRVLLEIGDLNAAEVALRQAAELAPSAIQEALLIDLMLRQHRTWAAAERLALALARFSVAPGGELAAVAERLCAASERDCAGWCGIAPDGTVVGQAILPGARGRLIASGSGKVGTHLLELRAGKDGIADFRLPASNIAEMLHLSVEGRNLTGSPLCIPPAYVLDGRAALEKGEVCGWVRLEWDTARDLMLEVRDDHGHRRRIRTQRVTDGDGRRRFSFPAHSFAGERLWIRAVLPDGTELLLPDAPLLLGRALRPVLRLSGAVGRKPHVGPPAGAHVSRFIDVIVPVYAGRLETARCLQSVLDTVGGRAEVVVVDDATPEPGIAADLDALAAAGRITLLRNEHNLGFTASVNRGIALHPERDVVLLNSDTWVGGDWLERLRRTAAAHPDAATLTPWSDDGSFVSYRSAQFTPVERLEVDAIDRACALACSGEAPEVPVGVGFCMFVRRDALEQVGSFDEVGFTRGYGEETDFCLRAAAAGWRHRLAADVFVHHVGGRSFGRARAALLDRGARIVNRRFPGYDRWIARHLAADGLRPFRRRLDEHRLAEMEKPVVLLVTLERAGGVDRFLVERCERLRASGLVPVVLRPTLPDDPTSCTLFSESPVICDLSFRIPDEIEGLERALRAMPVAHAELHHFLGLDPRVVNCVRGLGVPYDVHVHDYVWICPRVSLYGSDRRYCGEPAVAACETCVARNGAVLEPALSVRRLRRRSAEWLSRARRVVVPTRDVQQRMARYFPGVSTSVEPLERGIVPGASPIPRVAGPVVRVVLLGALGHHKGYRVLLDCARDAARRRLPLEFVVIGYSSNDAPLLQTGKVFVTGRYTDGEVPQLLARERPSVAFYPSVVPETWCYALTPAIRAGLPVVAFDIGAIAERLRDVGINYMAPLDASARALNDVFLRIGAPGSAMDNFATRSIEASDPPENAKARRPSV